jgi:hypothetical protein
VFAIEARVRLESAGGGSVPSNAFWRESSQYNVIWREFGNREQREIQYTYLVVVCGRVDREFSCLCRER